MAVNDTRARPHVDMGTQAPANHWACRSCNVLGFKEPLLSSTVYPSSPRRLDDSKESKRLLKEWKRRFHKSPEMIAALDRYVSDCMYPNIPMHRNTCFDASFYINRCIDIYETMHRYIYNDASIYIKRCIDTHKTMHRYISNDVSVLLYIDLSSGETELFGSRLVVWQMRLRTCLWLLRREHFMREATTGQIVSLSNSDWT